MKAKCPHCEAGCSKCEDGYFEVKFALGDVYTRACSSATCGFENGGRISTTLLEGECGPCVRCSGPAHWKRVDRG